jgi:hypothetical protein
MDSKWKVLGEGWCRLLASNPDADQMSIAVHLLLMKKHWKVVQVLSSGYADALNGFLPLCIHCFLPDIHLPWRTFFVLAQRW